MQYAESVDRVSKERAMRRRQLKWLWNRLPELAAMDVRREEMLIKLGAARARAPTAWRLVDIAMDKAGAGSTPSTARSCDRSDGAKDAICCGPISPRTTPRCCGSISYSTRCGGTGVQEPEGRSGDTASIFHQDERRVEAHIFIAFLAYCLADHPAASPARSGAGLTARSAGEVRRRADDRRASANHRRPRAVAHSLY